LFGASDAEHNYLVQSRNMYSKVNGFYPRNYMCFYSWSVSVLHIGGFVKGGSQFTRTYTSLTVPQITYNNRKIAI